MQLFPSENTAERSCQRGRARWKAAVDAVILACFIGGGPLQLNDPACLQHLILDAGASRDQDALRAERMLAETEHGGAVRLLVGATEVDLRSQEGRDKKNAVAGSRESHFGTRKCEILQSWVWYCSGVRLGRS